MKCKLALVMCTFLLLSGCDAHKQAEVTKGRVVIPLFDECRQFVSSYLNKTPEPIGLTYSIIDFDYVPRAVPTLVGYIEIKSARQSNEQLLSVANSFILSCYPESKTSIEKNTNNAGDLLLNTLRVNERAGNKKSYIVDDGDEIYIYINR